MLLKKLKKQKMAIGILGQKIVIYGDNGTGKTTVAIEIGKQLCKQITNNPDAAPLVIGFENGTNASDDFYYVDGTDYDQTREILSDILKKSNRKYLLDTNPVIIVDGAEKIPTIAKDYVTSKKDIETLGDLGYGKGWDIFKGCTDAPFIQLMALTGVTVIFIFHEEVKNKDKDGEVEYSIPSGSAKENGVCKYIRDNSDFCFYLSRPINDKGGKDFSRAYCDDTEEHFGRNRYGEGADTFDIDFSAQSVMDYIEECGKKLAEKRGVDYTSIVAKQEESDNEMTHDELVEEIGRIGKILYKTSAKERAKEIVESYTESTENGRVSEIDSDGQLRYLLTDLTALASDKDIEID